MTVIIGLEHKGKVYMGADSSSSDGWVMRRTTLKKVFTRGPFMIGYTDSFRMGQIIQYHLAELVRSEYGTDEEFMVAGFIEAVRMALKDFGNMRVQDGQESGGSFLVAYNNKLYEIDRDQQVNHYGHDHFTTVGSGEQVALGAMAALGQAKMSPRSRIKSALAITGELITTVCPPYYVEVQK